MNKQARRWMTFPNLMYGDVHKQMTAVCHFFFTSNTTEKETLLEAQLKTRNSHWSTVVQLAACSKTDRVIQLAARQIVATKNAAIFASTLQSDFSLHYNLKFRRAFWSQIGKLTTEEKRLLFSVDEITPRTISKTLIHSIRSAEELNQVDIYIYNEKTFVPCLKWHISYCVSTAK
ncbi:hypothetical protein DICVIV_08583 [Dictyocaulus viviparus]|uniref:Uncharacterized protein n=1 Tax=Dictyocaulus viviparus TaxID=29172 RepID=A0A0D8XLG5_DICVI|nr:hypothetical protein DICVIV_08583 [Dictyocaulus viviparus]